MICIAANSALKPTLRTLRPDSPRDCCFCTLVRMRRCAHLLGVPSPYLNYRVGCFLHGTFGNVALHITVNA